MEELLPKRARLDSGDLPNSLSSCNTLYLYIPDSPSTLDGSESNYSFQLYETDSCKDSPDLPTTSGEESSDFSLDNLHAEAEAVKPSDDVSDSSSSSVTITVNVYEADGENSCTSLDSELSNSDKWTCSRCKVRNSPRKGYCEKCYEVRDNWLPSKKFRRRRQRKKTSFSVAKKSCAAQKQILAASLKRESSLTTDSGLGTSQEPCAPCSSSSELSVIQNEMCRFCGMLPRNASIVHGKVGHQFSCYTCAVKIWKQEGRCPLCNKRIDRVIENIFT